ncbi:MAG: class II glutamine amidotransferase, partial [Mycoplasmatales bacterium]
MCGIVGCIGNVDANEVVLKGLERLEYRGYDSCGVASINEDSFHISKSTNRISDLIEINELSNNIAIGHTRWATHGGVNLANSHPHQSSNDRFILVHNGVIDNYLDLKEKFCEGVEFKSQTDTEVILEVLSSLIEKHGTFESAMMEFFNLVHGSYSCVLMDIKNQEKLFTFKNKTPMLIGSGKEIYTISSDPCACYDIVETFYRLEDKEFAIIDADNSSVSIFDVNGNPVDFEFEKIDIDDMVLELGEYDCFMLKEIEEQPSVIKNIIKQYGDYVINPELKKNILAAKKIYIVASGTSYNAGLVTRRMIQRDLKISTEVVLGSEFGYDDNLIDDNSFFIFMS